MFDIVVREWGIMDRITIGDRVRECFWHFVKDGMVKGRSRHGCEGERRKCY
jgi:hypothetical protein